MTGARLRALVLAIVALAGAAAIGFAVAGRGPKVPPPRRTQSSSATRSSAGWASGCAIKSNRPRCSSAGDVTLIGTTR